MAVVIAVGNKTKRQGRTELFWAVDRADRYRICGELVQLAGRVVIVCRTQADASRVARELSRHGVPAASVEHRDFGAAHVRAQVVTDETALSCARGGARCVVQFDPAGGPRRYRRRLELLASPGAIVVTLVVPERMAETHVLLADLDLPDVITGADLATVRRVLTRARADDELPAGSDATAPRRAIARVSHVARRAVGTVARRVRDRHPTGAEPGSAGGDEATFHGDQRAS